MKMSFSVGYGMEKLHVKIEEREIADALLKHSFTLKKQVSTKEAKIFEKATVLFPSIP